MFPKRKVCTARHRLHPWHGPEMVHVQQAKPLSLLNSRGMARRQLWSHNIHAPTQPRAQQVQIHIQIQIQPGCAALLAGSQLQPCNMQSCALTQECGLSMPTPAQINPSTLPGLLPKHCHKAAMMAELAIQRTYSRAC